MIIDLTTLYICQYDRLTMCWTKEVRETHRTTKLRLRELKSVSVNRKNKGLLLIKKKHWSLKRNSVWKIQTTRERNLNTLANFSIKTLGGREVNHSANKCRDFAFSPILKYPDHFYNLKASSKIWILISMGPCELWEVCQGDVGDQLVPLYLVGWAWAFGQGILQNNMIRSTSSSLRILVIFNFQ